MELSKTEEILLRAMQYVHDQRHSRKSVVTLRHALRASGDWADAMESALCNAGDEHPLVDEYYTALRALVHDTPLADGKGNLDLPAGPRYTECWITQAGIDRLRQLDDDHKG